MQRHLRLIVRPIFDNAVAEHLDRAFTPDSASDRSLHAPQPLLGAEEGCVIVHAFTFNHYFNGHFNNNFNG
ncbi:MAG: hypothetical protein HQL50_07690 [Magnetococcales bacterium]|nr:hypothetical protein [Magnetococcales bacterium]